MTRRTRTILVVVLVLIVVYFLGPAPRTPRFDTTLPAVPQDPAALEQYVAANEAKHKLKPDNEARIIWADSTHKKTPYSVVYLHGFSACQEEGDPVHIDFAKKFGANLYLARLADHGIDTTEQLLYFTGDRFWESSKEALQIAKAMGEKVIVMSTSTGGTMALMLAAEFPDDVYAMINMSPNIRINDPAAFVSNNHWGLPLVKMVLGGDYNVVEYDSTARYQYWNTKYRAESVPELEEILEQRMNANTFEKVKCPTLTLYYYKDEEHQDPTVKVSAILDMHEKLGTPEDMKVKVAIPNAGSHVLGSPMASGDVPAVEKACDDFAIEKLKLTPVEPGLVVLN
jgi:pimeloyl-ACP methyl ester carboxylesterase